MTEKTIFELEFVLKTTPKLLNNLLFTPGGLSEWFCDDVRVKDDLYTFIWDGSEEYARLKSLKAGQQIKWQWEDDADENDVYFGFAYKIDPITNAVILIVTTASDEEDKEETIALWEQHINDLKRLIGA